MPTVVQQVVSQDGTFEAAGVSEFLQDQAIEAAGVNYQIVAVTGPQSSGKSTLMNSLFGTDFQEMNAVLGRQQTTKGIWLAKSSKVEDPITLVLDLEGSDGRERGEDDNSFERQSSLFALAITDILVVNMWAKDIGREAGAGKPLLKTIFQVNLKLFAPTLHRKRTVLLFAFRDKTKTPLKRLIETWEEDLAQMWESITKPAAYEHCSFTDLFQVEYASLPNFEEKEEDFKAETYLLRKRFTTDEEGSLVHRSADQLPGSSLALSMSKLWQVIKEQRDLNLPAHKVMVATVRCQELATSQLQALQADHAFAEVRQAAAAGLSPSFAERAGSLVNSCLAGYDEEAQYFEETVRQAKRQELQDRAFELLKPSFLAQLGFLREAALRHVTTSLAGDAVTADFAEHADRCGWEAMQQFAEGAWQATVPASGWDATSAAAQLREDIDTQILQEREQQVGRIRSRIESALQGQVFRKAEPLFESCPPNLWERLHQAVQASTRSTEEDAATSLAGFSLPEVELQALHEMLEHTALAEAHRLARSAADTVLVRMDQRFSQLFAEDENGIPRTWDPKISIPQVTQNARQGAAEVLALLAADRLSCSEEDFRDVGAMIMGLAAEAPSSDGSASTGGPRGMARSASRYVPDAELLALDEWPGLCPSAVLIQPGKCINLWRQFCTDSGRAVQQAVAVQDMRKTTTNRRPPLWLISALLLLGWNELTTVLYNPLLLVIICLVCLFVKTVYDELEVDAELQRGLLPGLLSLTNKFMPTVSNVARRSGSQIAGFLQDPRAQATAAVRRLGAATEQWNHGRADANRRHAQALALAKSHLLPADHEPEPEPHKDVPMPETQLQNGVGGIRHRQVTAEEALAASWYD